MTNKAIERMGAVEARDLYRQIETGIQKMEREYNRVALMLEEFDRREGWRAMGKSSLHDAVSSLGNMTKARAYQLIEHARTIRALEQGGDDLAKHASSIPERATRRMRGLPDDQRVEVVRQAAQLARNDGKSDAAIMVPQITEAHIRRAIKKTSEDVVETQHADEGDQDGGTWAGIAEDEIKDGVGSIVVVESQKDAFALRVLCLRDLRDAKRHVDSILEWVGRPGSELMNQAAIRMHLEGIEQEVRGGVPYMVCRECSGGGCDDCEGRGWMTRRQYQEAVSNEC